MHDICIARDVWIALGFASLWPRYMPSFVRGRHFSGLKNEIMVTIDVCCDSYWSLADGHDTHDLAPAHI